MCVCDRSRHTSLAVLEVLLATRDGSIVVVDRDGECKKEDMSQLLSNGALVLHKDRAVIGRQVPRAQIYS